MKKTALSLSLLFTLLAGCLVGCDVSSKKDEEGKQVLFTVESQNVCADDLLGLDKKLAYDFLSTDEGTQAIYEEVYKSLAKKYVERTATIDSNVTEKMDDWAEQVESYASSNGVTKNNASKTLLEQAGFETEAELKESYYVEEQMAELIELFKKEQMEPASQEAIGSGEKTLLEQYVTDAKPMIVKHILTNVADSSTIYNKAEIAEAEVEKFLTVVQRLVLGKSSGNTFREIAKDESDDGSASKGGNLGIVDRYTSFVPEFKEGMYVASMISAEDQKAAEALAGAANSEEFDAKINEYKENNVKYIDALALSCVLEYCKADEAKDVQEDYGHEKKEDYDSDLYPRNYLYNKYLNCPSVQVLKVDVDNLDENIKNLLSEAFHVHSIDEINNLLNLVKNTECYKAYTSEEFANKLSAKEFANYNGNKLVVDENENPVIVCKSTYGFHFISVTWSSVGKTDAEAVKFFMTGSAASGATYYKPTATTELEKILDFGYTSQTTARNTRKSEIEERILNYIKGGYESITTNDSLYEYKIFEHYLNKGEIKFQNETVKANVTKFTESAKTYKNQEIENAEINTWDSYFEACDAYNEAYDLFYAIVRE